MHTISGSSVLTLPLLLDKHQTRDFGFAIKTITVLAECKWREGTENIILDIHESQSSV